VTCHKQPSIKPLTTVVIINITAVFYYLPAISIHFGYPESNLKLLNGETVSAFHNKRQQPKPSPFGPRLKDESFVLDAKI
jgi:hypothetical protein